MCPCKARVYKRSNVYTRHVERTKNSKNNDNKKKKLKARRKKEEEEKEE